MGERDQPKKQNGYIIGKVDMKGLHGQKLRITFTCERSGV